MSAEAKEKILLTHIRESGEFYNIKEIESTVAKRTGINSMQIKLVLKALTDSSLVRSEKIGSGNYYWSFPSDSKVAAQAQVEKLQKAVLSLESELDQVSKQVDDEEKLRVLVF